MIEEDEYDHGFEDALDLVNSYIEKYKDKLPEQFVLAIKEIIQETKDKKIAALKKDLCLTDSEISVKEKKPKK